MTVVVLIEREVIASSFYVAKVNGKKVRALIITNVDRSSHLMISESPVYIVVGKVVTRQYIVNQSAAEYVTYGGFKNKHTAEKFLRDFERGVSGTYPRSCYPLWLLP